MADPGVSPHQLDERSRSFSYHGDAPLDMRMDASQMLTPILRDYGEES